MSQYFPPPGSGDLRAYLFALSEKLNVALGELEAPAAAVTERLSSERESLRALVSGTASIINKELSRSESALRQELSAISESVGSLKESISSEMLTAAGAAIHQLGYDAALETLSGQTEGLTSYKAHTEGFIRQGFIELDEQGVPIVGIAIGRGLTATEVTIDGVTYTRLDASRPCAFYTADRVSFRINGAEAAYISNSRFCMGEGFVSDALTVGPWRMDTKNGFAVKWVGERS